MSRHQPEPPLSLATPSRATEYATTAEKSVLRKGRCLRAFSARFSPISGPSFTPLFKSARRPGQALAAFVVSTELLLTGATGCQPPKQPSPSTLRVAIEAAPSSLDPRRSIDAFSSRISGLVHAGLLRDGPDGHPRPWLASEFEQTSPTQWVFQLRPGLRFHDGTALTTDDVVATFRSVIEPDSTSPKKAALASLLSVTADNAQRVVFDLKEEDAGFLEAASMGILPASVARQTAELTPTAMLGAGPYRLASASDDFEFIHLEASTHYWDEQANIQNIEFRVVPDAVMRTLELRHGSIDFVQNSVDPDNVVWLAENQSDLVVTIAPYDAYQYLGINHRHPVLSDLRVRRAIAHAIDRESIIKYLLAGHAEPASGMLPPHHWGYYEKVRSYKFSPRRARRLLDQAGLLDPDGAGPEPRLRLVYKTTNLEVRRRIAEVLASQLAEVGIELEIRSYEWGTFFGDIRRGDFHLFSLAWVGITDPDIMRSVFHSELTPPAGNNRGYYANTRIDKLTEKARSGNQADRRKVLNRIQRATARQLPYVPLWWPAQVIVASNRLVGFQPSPSGDLLPLASAKLQPRP